LKEKNRKSGIAMVIFILILIVSLCIVGYKYFRVAKIEVQGNFKIESAYITSLSGIEIDDNLFAISKNRIEKSINADPYLEFFDLKRIYPSMIRIEVYERTPLVTVLYNDVGYVLDRDANILEEITSDVFRYTNVVGLEIETPIVGQKLKVNNDYEIESLLNIIKNVNFPLINEDVVEIDFTNINNIYMQTAQGFVVKFGQSKMVFEKAVWMDSVIDELANMGINSGVINVTSGDSATYSDR